MSLVKRYFDSNYEAKAFVDGMVEALRTMGEPAEDKIWGIETYESLQNTYVGLGSVHVKQKRVWVAEWNVED